MSKTITCTRIIDGYRFKTIWTGPLQEIFHLSPKGVETKVAEFKSGDKGVRLLQTPWQEQALTMGLPVPSKHKPHDEANEIACVRVARSLRLAKQPRNIDMKTVLQGSQAKGKGTPKKTTPKPSQKPRRALQAVTPALDPSLRKDELWAILGPLSKGA